MTTLKVLADARREILEAELAALLHNLGKLDPNFLAQRVQDSQDALAVVANHFFDIPEYQFKRFAAPAQELIRDDVCNVLFRTNWRSRGRRALWQELAKLDLWTEQDRAALETLLGDFNAEREHHPFLARELEAAWMLYFFSTSNGPLYLCHVPERKKTRTELERLQSQLVSLNAALQAASPGDKPTIGRQLNEVRSQIQNLQNVPSEQEAKEQAVLEAKFRNIVLELGEERWPLADLLTLFWDTPFFYWDDEEGYVRRSTLIRWLKPGYATQIPALLILSHGEVSGGDKGTMPEDELDDTGESAPVASLVHPITPTVRPKWAALTLASAFGHEKAVFAPWELAEQRRRLVETTLDVIGKLEDERSTLLKVARETLGNALSDSRWPWNEITLWDYASSIAALFKSCMAKAVLNGALLSLPEVRWRLLHISFDGPAFWGQAHHVTDMLGRRQALEEGLDAVRDILEVEYPLGNEVYRDEHGSVFVVPNVDNPLELKDEAGKSLKKLLAKAFDAEGIRGELVPEIEVSAPYLGKKIDLAGVLQSRRRENAPRADVLAKWWTEGQRPPNAEICTVCGQRPVGYVEPGLEKWVTSQKAKDRNVCGVCLHRRGRRARDWARNVKAEEEKIGPFKRTIWIDEVADNNGRFALVVGRFILEGWLDGKLIPTMLKLPSFARIRRCWETTHQFWMEVQNEVIPDKVGKRVRLGIRPSNTSDLRQVLGPWHTYEADVSGRRLGLCWDPNGEGANDRDLFWTTDNLNYLAAQLRITVEKLEERLWSQKLPLYEPGGYLGQDRPVEKDAEGCLVVRREHFLPYIPLLAEPATFMVLVPADRALKVAQAIKKKYDREMARVRDRLPLHLGLVFARRRTPLSAVLEAGRAMLEMPAGWEEWQIAATGRKATFSRDGHVFEWEYPAKMGDDETKDIWYPHLLLANPESKAELSLEAKDFHLVDDFTGTVYIRPSRFDFVFLDTTARRFEVHYGGDGRRPRRTRPYLLDDLDRLEKLWEEMCYLEKSQRHQVVSTIEATREAWFGDDQKGKSWNDEVFRQFVHDTLAGAAWPRDRKWDISKETRRQLEDAGVTGELADLFELHMQILKEK